MSTPLLDTYLPMPCTAWSPTTTGLQKLNLRQQSIYSVLSSTPWLAVILTGLGAADWGMWAFVLIVFGKESRHMCVTGGGRGDGIGSQVEMAWTLTSLSFRGNTLISLLVSVTQHTHIHTYSHITPLCMTAQDLDGSTSTLNKTSFPFISSQTQG